MLAAMILSAALAAKPVPDAAIRRHAYDVLVRRMDHYVHPRPIGDALTEALRRADGFNHSDRRPDGRPA